MSGSWRHNLTDRIDGALQASLPGGTSAELKLALSTGSIRSAALVGFHGLLVYPVAGMAGLLVQWRRFVVGARAFYSNPNVGDGYWADGNHRADHTVVIHPGRLAGAISVAAAFGEDVQLLPELNIWMTHDERIHLALGVSYSWLR